jgi:flavin reductase (DIM6/NTAB) family NADH-FMN oxidoreductase RutF
MRLTAGDFAQMESRYRAALANSLTGFKSANLVGSADAGGVANLAIMSSVVHLGSHPPLLAIVIRPDSLDRHTLGNITETGFYTICHVAASFVESAHQTAARYERDVSEFDATGLTPVWEDDFPAPFVGESGVRLGLQLREHQHLRINDTNLVIGEVVLAFLPSEAVNAAGNLDLSRTDSVAVSGLDTYYSPLRLKRMAYAKPGLPPRVIDN